MAQAAQLSFLDVPIEAVVRRLVVPPEQRRRLQNGGAEYLPEFITRQEESALITAIDATNWITDLRRRVQHYGYRYNYTKRNLSADDKIGALPEWAAGLCDRLLAQGVFSQYPEQLIVNEYQPGQGIAAHTDRDCFGEVLAGISLSSDCLMDIYPHPKDKNTSFAIALERRSLLAMRGASREQWLHGIRPNKSDTQNGHKIPRNRRLSLTFRTVKK